MQTNKRKGKEKCQEIPGRRTTQTVKDGRDRDRISDLPDSLAVYILNFLKISNVIQTSILSKRWRYMWRLVTCLDFEGIGWGRQEGLHRDLGFGRGGRTRASTFIDRSLFNREGSKIKKFKLDYSVEENVPLKFDSWIHFVIRCNVEELSLDFSVVVVPCYRLPRVVFSYRSLRTLTLSCCDLNLPASMELSSLKTLNLIMMNISDDDIARLTSSSPLLEELMLNACVHSNDINIINGNPNFKYLKIYEDSAFDGPKIFINAAYLVSLAVGWPNPMAKYVLKNSSSLLNASFVHPDAWEIPDIEFDEHDGDDCARLLCDLNHVRNLNIGDHFLEVLSLRRKQKLYSFPISATKICLQAAMIKRYLPGISYILKNSSKLEELTMSDRIRPNIKVDRVLEKVFDFEEKGFWKSEDFDFCSTLQNLKTVTINIKPTTKQNVNAFLKDVESQVEFVEFLLKNSKALEMVTVKCGENDAKRKKYMLLFKLTERLILLPRASPNAKISIR